MIIRLTSVWQLLLSRGQAHITFSFKMAGQTTTAKFSDLYDLKEELGK